MHKSMLWPVWLAILGGPALAAGIDCTKQLTQQLHCEEGDMSCGGQ